MPLWVLPLFILLNSCPGFIKSQPLQRFEFSDQQMGTTFRLVFYAPGDSIADRAAQQAFQKVNDLNSILSDYKDDSELNRISHKSGSSHWISVSSPLYYVLAKAQAVSRKTEGAFDVTVGPYVKLWRQLSREYDPQLPTRNTLAKLSESVGYKNLKISPEKQAVQLIRRNMQLDVGGIAKGFAADEALETLQKHGIRSALVNAGGDITAGEAPPGKKGWKIAIRVHKADGATTHIMLQLVNKAIATSGDLFQFTEIGGRRYSHIVNPKTGMGITGQRTVTVIAPDGITADSYASALSVLKPRKSIQFLEQKPELSGFLEYRADGSIRQRFSADFERYRDPSVSN